MAVKIICGDALTILRQVPDEVVHTCVTSPPYWGLRDYGTAKWEGGDSSCAHTGSDRWYTEQGASSVSSEAFSEAGPANAERLKKARWREGGVCTKCGAKHSDRQLGLEASPQDYVSTMVEVFREVHRVLRKDGTLWLNLGDSYTSGGRGGGGSFASERPGWDGMPMEWGKKRGIPGLKPKDIVGIPWRVAFALQADGWYLRQDIIWSKPNPMPESVTDRCTKSHEYLFMLSKSPRYYYDADAVAEPVADATRTRLAQPTLARQGGSARVPGKTNGNMKAVLRKQNGHGRRYDGFNERFFNSEDYPQMRNRRSVWTITTKPFKEAHFATFPPDLVEPCILAGCPERGFVLDPFAGSGTVGMVANKLNRHAFLIDLNPAYVEMAERRCGLRVTPPATGALNANRADQDRAEPYPHPHSAAPG